MNAIVTAATGYGKADLTPFLGSVSRVCSNTKVFLIAFSRDRKVIEDLKREYPFIEPVFVRRPPNRETRALRWLSRRLPTTNFIFPRPLASLVRRGSLNISVRRFSVALDVVRSNRDSLERVLFADSRDVILQADPFAHVTDELISAREEITVERCSYNSEWLTAVYGPDTCRRMFDWQIVCAGVTLARVDRMEAYLSAMCREIETHLPQVARHGGYCDQAIHNYLIFSGHIKAHLTDNRHGLIATLHHENPKHFSVDPESGKLQVHGKWPAIVHQYDRHAQLNSFFAAASRSPTSAVTSTPA